MASVPKVKLQNNDPVALAMTTPSSGHFPPETPFTGNALTPASNIIQTLDQFRGSGEKYPFQDELQKSTNTVYTNLFELSIDPATTSYEYLILGIPAGKTKRMKKLIIDTAIRTIPFLANNQNSFATDYIGTLVSWIDLNPLCTSLLGEKGDAVTQEGRE